MEGFAAQRAFHDWADAHAGTLTDERMAQDVGALERARELRAQNEEMEHLSGEEVIATYGADFYHETYALVCINVAVCGPDGWGLPLQIADFSNPYAFTMGGAFLRALLLGYLISLGMTALTLLLSARLRSAMPVAVIPMAVVFLGMFAMFITPLVKLAVLTPLSGMNWSFRNMVSYALGPVVMDLPTALAVLYGAMLVALTPLAMRAFRRHQVA